MSDVRIKRNFALSSNETNEQKKIAALEIEIRKAQQSIGLLSQEIQLIAEALTSSGYSPSVLKKTLLIDPRSYLDLFDIVGDDLISLLELPLADSPGLWTTTATVRFSAKLDMSTQLNLVVKLGEAALGVSKPSLAITVNGKRLALQSADKSEFLFLIPESSHRRESVIEIRASRSKANIASTSSDRVVRIKSIIFSEAHP
jgi:hypothetical protein